MVSDSPQPPGPDVLVRAYPADVKARAKALYLVKCLQPRDIASKLGVPVEAVYDWVNRAGWAQVRRDKLAEVSGKVDNAMRGTDAFMEVVAAESEELALAGFERARGAVQSDSEFAAKDFASWTSGVKSLVGMYRTAKGLDASSGAPAITFNAFYTPAPHAQPKQAEEPSIDV